MVMNVLLQFSECRLQIHPAVREECKEKKCAQLAKHFEHCQEKVQSGQGFKGEDCVEELYVTNFTFRGSDC